MSESKVEEYKRKLEVFEQRQREAAQAIDLKELIKKSKELKSVSIEGFGELRYGSLTFADLVDVSKYQSNEERTIAIVYCMLKKAYPDITLDDVKNLPFDVSSKILAALSKEISFLQAT